MDRRGLSSEEIWAIRGRLQLSCRTRELALFNLGIDSELRAYDLVKLSVRDVATGDRAPARASVIQQKLGVPFNSNLDPIREAIANWMKVAHLRAEDFLFPSRVSTSPHIGTCQYARIVDGWVEEIGLKPARLWYVFDAAHKGLAGLSPNQESARG